MSAISTDLPRQLSVLGSTGATLNACTYTRYHRAYYYAFLGAAVVCWSPSKLLAYLAPWIALGIVLVMTRNKSTVHRLVLILAVWTVTLPLYALLTPGFVFHSALLILLTYGSFVFIWAVPSKRVSGPRLSEQMLYIARWLLLLEGGWGLVQGTLAGITRGTFDGAVGDAVAGTIRPFVITPDLSNPMFAINVTILLLILLPSLIKEGKGKLAYLLGLLSLIMASVLHVLFFLAIALVLAVFIYYPSLIRDKRGCLTLMVFLAFSFLASRMLHDNLRTLSTYVDYTLSGITPRAQIVSRAFSTMPDEYPWMPIMGLGPGQFGSRAGLIGTGLYFGTPANPKSIPLLPEGMSTPFKKHLYGLWMSLFFDSQGNYVHVQNNTSSTYQPFFSWLSVYAEFGVAGIIVPVALLLYLLLRSKKNAVSSHQKLIALSVGASCLFLFLLGIQENYWEVSQALLVGLMLIKVQYANLVHLDWTQ